MSARLDVTVFNDPGCPWGYSAIPQLRALEWRYGDQLAWRLVLIGLAEDAQLYIDRGYSPVRTACGWPSFRRFGMPFAPVPKARVSATAPACRAVVAARIDAPGSEWGVHRALQLAQFTTPLVLEDEAWLAAALTGAGFDGDALVARIGDDDVTAAYERDRVETRTAADTPGALQGKTANSDGLERYTAPSVVFERADQRLEAAGFQSLEAYDVLLANLDPGLVRREAPEDVGEILARFSDGVTTREAALIATRGNDAVDDLAVEIALIELVAEGRARRVALGDGALWTPIG